MPKTMFKSDFYEIIHQKIGIQALSETFFRFQVTLLVQILCYFLLWQLIKIILYVCFWLLRRNCVFYQTWRNVLAAAAEEGEEEEEEEKWEEERKS